MPKNLSTPKPQDLSDQGRSQTRFPCRIMHGVNFSFGLRKMILRVGGMVLTLTSLIIGAILALPL